MVAKQSDRRWILWIAAVVTAALAVGIVTAQPGLGAGSFTKAAAKKLFYTKKQSTQRYYTKPQANALFGLGATRIAVSPALWKNTNPVSGIQGNQQASGTTFNSGVIENVIMTVGGSIPTVLDGRPMQLLGINACYATSNVAKLDSVRIQRTDNAANNTSSLLIDNTEREDNACRDYILSSPAPLGSNDTVYAEYLVEFPGGGGQSFTAGQVTFILEPQP